MPKERNKTGSRKLEKRLLIFCEGAKDKSESAYFKALIKSCNFAGNKVKVELVDSGKNTGKELVKEAKKRREFPDDELWVVYDKDGYLKHAETFNIARDNNIKIAFSAISFEYWILLHYEYTSKVFEKSEDIVSYLNSRGYIDYDKSSQNIFNLTKEFLENGTATENAERIQKHQKQANCNHFKVYEWNPYTNINELIGSIFEMQKIK